MDKKRYFKPSILFKESLCFEQIAADDFNFVSIPDAWQGLEGDNSFG